MAQRNIHSGHGIEKNCILYPDSGKDLSSHLTSHFRYVCLRECARTAKLKLGRLELSMSHFWPDPYLFVQCFVSFSASSFHLWPTPVQGRFKFSFVSHPIVSRKEPHVTIHLVVLNLVTTEDGRTLPSLRKCLDCGASVQTYSSMSRAGHETGV